MTFYKKLTILSVALYFGMYSGTSSKAFGETKVECIIKKEEVTSKKKKEENSKKTSDANMYIALGANVVPSLKLDMKPQSSTNENGVSSNVSYGNGVNPLFGAEAAFGGYAKIAGWRYLNAFIAQEIQYSFINYGKKFVDGDRSSEARMKHLVAINLKPGIKILNLDIYIKGSIGAGYFAHSYNNGCESSSEAFFKRWKFVYGFGAGVVFNITRNLGIMAEYTRLFTTKEDLTEYKNAIGEMRMDLLSLKVKYSF